MSDFDSPCSWDQTFYTAKESGMQSDSSQSDHQSNIYLAKFFNFEESEFSNTTSAINLDTSLERAEKIVERWLKKSCQEVNNNNINNCKNEKPGKSWKDGCIAQKDKQLFSQDFSPIETLGFNFKFTPLVSTKKSEEKTEFISATTKFKSRVPVLCTNSKQHRNNAKNCGFGESVVKNQLQNFSIIRNQSKKNENVGLHKLRGIQDSSRSIFKKGSSKKPYFSAYVFSDKKQGFAGKRKSVAVREIENSKHRQKLEASRRSFVANFEDTVKSKT